MAKARASRFLENLRISELASLHRSAGCLVPWAMASSGSGQTFANSFVIGHRAAALGHRHRRTMGQRTERPRCRRAAEQRDELAPFHCPVPPVLPTERIAHLLIRGRLLRCGISIRLMTGWGQTEKNSH